MASDSSFLFWLAWDLQFYPIISLHRLCWSLSFLLCARPGLQTGFPHGVASFLKPHSSPTQCNSRKSICVLFTAWRYHLSFSPPVFCPLQVIISQRLVVVDARGSVPCIILFGHRSRRTLFGTKAFCVATETSIFSLFVWTREMGENSDTVPLAAQGTLRFSLTHLKSIGFPRFSSHHVMCYRCCSHGNLPSTALCPLQNSSETCLYYQASAY